MTWLQSVYYSLGIAYMSLALLVTVLLIGLLVSLIIKIRRLEKKLKQLTPLLVATRIIGAFWSITRRRKK